MTVILTDTNQVAHERDFTKNERVAICGKQFNGPVSKIQTGTPTCPNCIIAAMEPNQEDYTALSYEYW